MTRQAVRRTNSDWGLTVNSHRNNVEVDRYWFLTWTTYGTWLPGDQRGYVGDAPNETGQIIEHNQFGMPPAPANDSLRASAERGLKSRPILLNADQATSLLNQLQETTQYRGWLLIAAAIMHSHLHAIVGVPGNPDPEKILGDLKAWGSRCLNRKWGKPASGTWWTTSGSKRKLPDEHAVETVIHYIRRQPNPHVIWTREDKSGA